MRDVGVASAAGITDIYAAERFAGPNYGVAIERTCVATQIVLSGARSVVLKVTVGHPGSVRGRRITNKNDARKH